MQKPTIHLNGSHGPTLLQEHLDAMNAVVKAQEVLVKIGPHGRDYTFPGQSINLAIIQHAERYKLLETVRRELEEIAIHISDQVQKP